MNTQTNTHVNYVHLAGNLGKDVQITTFESGKTKASFSLATSTSYRNNKGEDVTTTTWHNIVAWGQVAEKVSTLTKGARVEVKGSISNRNYQDKQGNTRYITEINCMTCDRLDEGTKISNTIAQPEPLF